MMVVRDSFQQFPLLIPNELTHAITSKVKNVRLLQIDSMYLTVSGALSYICIIWDWEEKNHYQKFLPCIDWFLLVSSSSAGGSLKFLSIEKNKKAVELTLGMSVHTSQLSLNNRSTQHSILIVSP